jgi:peptidoglycan/xylan/chitin deacetylase (PgdA/CDA1 family)
VRADLERAIRTLELITDRTPTLFRPPIGHTNPTIARIADQLDLVVVGWTVGARDGLARTRPADVVARVSRGLEDGAIVLLHDAPERGDRKPAGVAALGAILDAIAARNLRVTPLAAWLDEA